MTLFLFLIFLVGSFIRWWEMIFISHYLIKSNDANDAVPFANLESFFECLDSDCRFSLKLHKWFLCVELTELEWPLTFFIYLFEVGNFIRETASTRYELTTPNLQEITSAKLEGTKSQIRLSIHRIPFNEQLTN